jgi:hypothetical protein
MRARQSILSHPWKWRGEHPVGTVCPTVGVIYEEPSWVQEVLEYFRAA